MKKIRWNKVVVIGLIVLFTTVFFMGRKAESAEVGIGLNFGTFHSLGGRTQEINITSDDYRWFASYTRVGGVDAEDLHFESRNRYVAGYRVFWRRDENWKPYMMFGTAYWDEPPCRVISERLTYDMRIGVRYRDIVEFEIGHNSTAGRARYNYGFDTVGLRAVFQF